MPTQYPPCRICHSPNTAHVRDLEMNGVGQPVPLHYCIQCESLTTPKIFHEPDELLKEHAHWHISVEERNKRWGTNLLNAVQKRRNVNSVLEIGCATGTLLSVAKDRGMDTIGFDLNRYAVELGKERNGLDLRDELWTHDTLSKKFDLVCCISVMEHVEDPNALMAEIGAYCNRHSSSAIISVPFATERDILGEHLSNPLKPPNPLRLKGHINHFCHSAFQDLARRNGAWHAEHFPYGWHDNYWLEF